MAGTSKLSNADFRKLLETPRVVAGPAEKPADESGAAPKSKKPFDPQSRKKKKEYQKVLDERKALEKEQAEKYRDRAAERRKGINADYDDHEALVKAYKQAAADDDGNLDAAEKRRRQIEESKFLGGDIKHTHMVKGLDFALLQKVRAELEAESKKAEEEEEENKPAEEEAKKEPDAQPANETVVCRSRMARGVYNILFSQQAPTRNELFQPGRMAYFVELENLREKNPLDAPTTVIRSKAECPEVQPASKVTTNDIVVNKLTQILSYLRQGTRQSKKKKSKEKIKSKPAEKKKIQVVDEGLDMFGEGQDTESSETASRVVKLQTAKPAAKPTTKKYFDDADDVTKASAGTTASKAELYAKDVIAKFSAIAGSDGEKIISDEKEKEESNLKSRLAKLEPQEDSYAEYYPGMSDMVMMAYDEEDTEKSAKEIKLEAYRAKKEGRDPNESNGGGNNRKARRAKQAEEKKLASDLKQINQLMDKRKADKASGKAVSKKQRI